MTHEANANYNPVNRFVGGSYQLDRVIKTFVLNNTYVLNPTTVLTLRGGFNKFDDNYNLPQAFDATTLGWPSSLTSADLRHQPVPVDVDDRLQEHGLDAAGRPTATTSTASTAR